MARTDPQVNFRMPQSLKDKLEQSAKNNGRSITSELIIRLEQTFTNEKLCTQTIDISNTLADIMKEIQSLKNEKTA